MWHLVFGTFQIYHHPYQNHNIITQLDHHGLKEGTGVSIGGKLSKAGYKQ